MPNLTDCTETLRLVYDRGPDGYGVPVYGSRFKGTSKLQGVLMDVREDFKTIGWLPHIESVLTGGLYVDKKGAHGDGEAIDIDGAVLVRNPVDCERFPIVLTYGPTAVPQRGPKPKYIITRMPPRTRTRLACLLSRWFGVVLTAGYNQAHEDHIHADLSRTIGWIHSKSQITLVQETLNAWFNTNLRVDGILGVKTVKAWAKVATKKEFFNPHLGWLDWLKMIAFNPPKDVK